MQGPTGPQGPQGEVGPANTLTIGTVTTLDTGVPATASITGTAPNQVLNLGIPRGLPGANGTVINVAGSEASTLNFTSDPQTQLNTISGNVNNNQADISELQSDVAGKSSVYVNNSLSNVSFTSDPQTQLNNLNTTITNNYNALNSSINTNTQKIDLINKTVTLLYSGNPGKNDIFNLSQPITEFSYIMLQTETNGGTRPSVIIPVNQIDGYTETTGYIANASISGTTRQTVFNFNSTTAIRIGSKTNTSTVTVYGIK